MTRFILREPYRHLIIPRPDLGLFCSRKNAKRRGYPFELIFKVKRHERSEH